MDWNFDKLPKAEYNKAITFYENAQWKDLAQLHNDYQLSEYLYCCQGTNEAMQSWWGHAIKHNIIYEISGKNIESMD